jgi:transposase InsO family protein
MGRVGACFDNAAAEAFFSTLEHEVLSRHRFTTRAEAREVLVAWCLEFYNVRRRHSSAGLRRATSGRSARGDEARCSRAGVPPTLGGAQNRNRSGGRSRR